MNSKIYLIIGLAILALAAYTWFKRTSSQSSTNQYNNQITNNNQEINNSELTTMVETQPINQPLNDGIYQITPDSQINWQGSKTLIDNYKDSGTLAFKSGQITITDNQISSGSFVFDMTKLKADTTGRGGGQSSLEKHLQSADFFNVEQYPEASFVLKSANLKPDSNNSYQINGDLTIKNITQPINFLANIENQSEKLKLLAEIKLDRTLWDIRYGSDKFFDNLANNVIDDIFTVTLDLMANKQ